MRSRNVIIIGSDVPNNCFKVSFTLRISEKKKKKKTRRRQIFASNTGLLECTLKICLASGRRHTCIAVGYLDFDTMGRKGGWQRGGGGARRGYGSNGKIRSILFQTSLKHGVDMPDSPGLSRTCGVG